MPKTFMVKKDRRLRATSTPTTVFTSGEKMTSRGIWSPWCDSPISSLSGHLVQQTGRTLVDVGKATGVTSSRECISSFPVNDHQYNTLWSPYPDAELGELLLFYVYAAY